MHKLNLHNDYHREVMFDIDGAVKPGQSMSQATSAKEFFIKTEGLDTMTVLFLGEDRIPEYEHVKLKGEFGVLFRFATVEIYSRYDGTGEYNITLDKYGDMHVKTINGQSVLIKLPGLILE